jgi:mono/diheme cytochrome c family protein
VQWEKVLSEGAKNADGKQTMPAYKDKMKPEEIKEMVKYSRSFKGK